MLGDSERLAGVGARSAGRPRQAVDNSRKREHTVIMSSYYDHFSSAVDYGAYPTYDACFHSANDAWVQDQWSNVGVIELDPVVEAWSMSTPISPEAVAIRADVDMMLAALESSQEVSCVVSSKNAAPSWA